MTAAIVVLVFACSEGGLREDEIECEEAASHLADCCPGFQPSTLACRYHEGSCGTTFPDLTATEGACIRSRSCDDLVSSGVCAKAAAAADAGAHEKLAQAACP